MSQVNEGLLFQPDERPGHLVSFLLGFQSVSGQLTAMAASASIIAAAGGQSEDYLSWILFAAFVACGIATILQVVRIGRFGSGYPINIASSSAFIAICISALVAGGPALLSTLIVASTLVQFIFISRLSLLRRVITPVVAGTALMLMAGTVITLVFGRLTDVPEGTPVAAAPVLAGVTLAVLLGMRFYTSAKWQQWSAVAAIVAGCILSAFWGLYDFERVAEAPWIGIPSVEWSGFDLSFDATFWGLLPGFVIVFLATTINSISSTVVMQQVAWRRPRATDFRVVQGAQYVGAASNLLAAALGTVPNLVGTAVTARILLTGVAARRMGIYAGLVLIAAALSPKIIALIAATPRPILVAYIVFMLSLLFVQGMRTATRDGIDGKKAAIIGVSLWLGIGFQNQVILPELLTGTLGTLLSNGMTTGSVSVILLTMLTDLTFMQRKRLNVEMNLSSLPRIDSFLRDFAASSGWNSASISRLRSAGEETLSSLLSQENGEASSGRRLVINASRNNNIIELEFMATTGGDNLEDKLAYLKEQPEIQNEEEISFRLLRHYASSVRHRKYHDIDIISVQVTATA